MTKPTKSKLKKKCVELLNRYIREKAGCCQRCGKTTMLQASHIYSKGAYRNLELEPANILCLCYRCHIHWFHKEPTEASEWLQEKFLDRMSYLLTIKKKSKQMKLSDYEKLYEELKKKEVK